LVLRGRKELEDGENCILRVTKLKRVKWLRREAGLGEVRNEYKILVGKPAGKRPLGRPQHRWKDNTETYLKQMVYDSVEWIRRAEGGLQWWAL
jgi:hypothetical protein